MSRYRFHNHPPRCRNFSILPKNWRDCGIWISALYISASVLWLFASPASALGGMTSSQCKFLLNEFQKTFVQVGDGFPTIDNCDTNIVKLMWSQQIERVYSATGGGFETYEQLRTLPDELFARLLINAAAGSLLDSTQSSSDEAVLRIRVTPSGHFQRYIVNDNNRVVALQSMLILSILTLAVTWWQLALKGDTPKIAGH
jgi:hypothetical protein